MKASRITSRATCAISFALIVLSAACTKETPYQGQYKDDTLSKAQVSTDSEFLYVESYATVSRSSADAIPFYMGDEQLVKFRFSKQALEVVTVEKEKRFAKNEQNNKVILTIPVEHKSYRCETDRFGECKNREEENKDIPDLDKDMFKPDFTRMSEVATAPLPADLKKYFNGCYEEKGQKPVKFDFTPDAVNLQIEKTYQLKADCANDGNDFRDSQVVSIVYHHSFLKLNKFASPNYKPVLYPDTDEKTFGFFTTERTKLDQDNRDLEKNKQVYMNRWNPERSEVVYYLSDEFDKPENAALKKSAHLSFDKMNDGLVKSGAKFKLVLKDPEHKEAGDIRNNMIVLVEDPSGAGLLGYGPVAANPYTGEILSGRVVMFSGILKTGLQRTYEEMRHRRAQSSGTKLDLKKDTALARPTTNAPITRALRGTPSLISTAAGAARKSSGGGFGTTTNARAPLTREKLDQIRAFVQSNRSPIQDVSAPAAGLQDDKLTGDIAIDTSIRRHLDRLTAMSKRCLYPIEYVNFDGVVMAGFEKQLGGSLKPWDDMTDSEKGSIMGALEPTIFEQVLIHEMGHNLGLRHNFKGSEDKDNWYKEGEIPGLSRKIPYSSVMDYGYSESNTLPVLGKYDIAALRFGYSRQVEVEKADSTKENPSYEMVDVKTTLDDLTKTLKTDADASTGNDAKNARKLRPYSYCTDEHVGANANCKRFDEGTNFTEIAQHWVRIYNDNYKFRNFRNGARNFSMFQDSEYIGARYENFLNLRLMYELYERLKNEFGIDDNNEAWQKDEFLADIRRAAIISGQFFMDLMKTPDYSCYVVDSRDPAKPRSFLVPIRVYSPSSLSCRDSAITLKDGYKIMGETGRFFQSQKDPNSTNPYADQIDIRGIWMDKLVAEKLLMLRQLRIPMFDRSTESYIDLPEIRPELQETIAQLLTDRVEADVQVSAFDAPSRTEHMVYGVASTQVIPRPMSDMASLMLKLPLQETTYNDQLLEDILRLVPSKTHFGSAHDFLEPFVVFKQSSLTTLPDSIAQAGGLAEVINGSIYAALPANSTAMRLLELRKCVRLLATITPEGRQMVLDAINNHVTTVPASVPPQLVETFREALTLQPATIVKLLNNEIPDLEYLDRTITRLPSRDIR